MYELAGAFVAGVVLGGVAFGLMGVAFGWDYGFVAGRIAERRAPDAIAMHDGLGEVS